MSESTTAPPRRVAPFVAGAVALVLAVLFGVLLVVEPSSDTAETVLLDRAAPAAVGEFDDGTALSCLAGAARGLYSTFSPPRAFPAETNIQNSSNLLISSAVWASTEQSSTPLFRTTTPLTSPRFLTSLAAIGRWCSMSTTHSRTGSVSLKCQRRGSLTRMALFEAG